MLPEPVFIARGEILNEIKPFNPFPGKAELEGQNNYYNILAAYLWRHTLHC
jgi:hypothetical protein